MVVGMPLFVATFFTWVDKDAPAFYGASGALGNERNFTNLRNKATLLPSCGRSGNKIIPQMDR